MPALQPPLTADERATALLRRLLDFHEWYQLAVYGCVDIQSPSVPNRIYRIWRHNGPIFQLEDGQLVDCLCVGPDPWARLPVDDRAAIHILMLRANEAEYLRTANHFGPCR